MPGLDSEREPPLLAGPPQSICLIRLSAIGDTCHAVPLIRSLQRKWPECRFTWIIGRIEAKLMSLLPEIEFLTVDKGRFAADWARLRPQLAGRRFDLLLHLHASFRANLLCTLVRAPIKLGFDRPRARDLQWLFTNRQIRPRSREHVLDSFWGFAEALGIFERRLEWNIRLPPEAVAYARRVIPDSRATLLISPCSSHALRNWRPEFYAQVADHAARRWNMRVVLCGGPSGIEREMGDRVVAAMAGVPIDQIGRDTLPQMLALLGEATVLLTPDSGPAHMATAVGTPVIGSVRGDQSGPQRALPQSTMVRQPLSRGGQNLHAPRTRTIAVVGENRAAGRHGFDSAARRDRTAGSIHAAPSAAPVTR